MRIYPIECELCGRQIFNAEDDWCGMCKDCFDETPENRMD